MKNNRLIIGKLNSQRLYIRLFNYKFFLHLKSEKDKLHIRFPIQV